MVAGVIIQKGVMMKRQYRDSMTVGFALFAIFFGAGNLIFPPYLGFSAGRDWLSATGGFLLTDPFLAILTVVVTTKLGGRIDDIGRRVGVNFAKGLGILTILLITSLVAVPRTAATVHEIAIAPNFPGISPVWTSIIFFSLTMYFVFNEGRVIDFIGNFLTPMLLITLAIFIIRVVFNPPGELSAPIVEGNQFIRGFMEGYQTMDALAAPLMAGIVVTDFVRRGYGHPEQSYHMVKKAGYIALALLIFVYSGLTYIGATMGSHFPASVTRVEILLGSFLQVFGGMGAVLIALIVTLACLTTSVGLTATCGDFFHSISNGRLSYKAIVLLSLVVSFLISLFTVDEIIIYAGPILEVIYPVMITLVLLSAVDRFIIYDMTYIGAVTGVLLMSIIEVASRLLGWTGFSQWLDHWIPLASIGLAWVMPAIILGIVFGLIGKYAAVGKRLADHNEVHTVYRT